MTPLSKRLLKSTNVKLNKLKKTLKQSHINMNSVTKPEKALLPNRMAIAEILFQTHDLYLIIA